jgi:signal transduction histidine kinase
VMKKFSIFIKAMLIISITISFNAVMISMIIAPSITDDIQQLEKKNGKDILHKTIIIIKNLHTDLEKFKQTELANRKQELQNITSVAWSMINSEYNQSKLIHVGEEQRQISEEFHNTLKKIYDENKGKMTPDEIKDYLKFFIRNYRYNNGIGYFFAVNFQSNVVLHPINQNLEGQDFSKVKDQDGVYFINEMVKICSEKSSGVLSYKWHNPKTGKIESKVSYVFVFEPFNWILGTGEYLSALNEKLKSQVMNIVNDLQYADDGYFFVIDYNNIIRAHPYWENKDFSKVRDIHGKLFIPEMISTARKQGAGYTKYWWPKNTADDTPSEILSYVRDFPNWQVIIGTGLYLDNIKKEVQRREGQFKQQLSQIIKETRIGKNGYLYIMNGKGKMLYHPNEYMRNLDVRKIKNHETGSFIFDDLIKASRGSKEYFYKWDTPEDKNNFIHNKVSWIEYYPEMDWYLCSSAYFSDFEQVSSATRNKLFFLEMIILVCTAIFSYVYFKKLLSPVANLSKAAREIAQGNYSARVKAQGDDEITQLSHSFNDMVDTIEDHLENLDQKVRVKTSQLSKANLELDEKNNQIQNSLLYAVNMQHSLLPDDSILKQFFKDYFIIWQPRDVVSGDIYFCYPTDTGCIFTVIDCTGHGVPGAFMTMITGSAFSSIINEKYLDNPAGMLTALNKFITHTLHQESQDSISDNGMDMGICSINEKEEKITYAGARFSLLMVDKDGLSELKGDRYSVGYKRTNISFTYTNHTIKITPDTAYYLFSDGIIDQTGGPMGFGFGKKQLKKLFIKNYQKPFFEQREIIIQSLLDYQGKQSRKDDITVAGFKF